MFEDPSMRGFLIHLTAFVLITAALAVINLLTTPQYLWFLWVLAGWGIGIAAHEVALLLRKTHRRERIFVDPKARGFVVHLFAYLAVLLLLVFVNLVTTPQVWWFYWVALGWGAGVLAHVWCVLSRHKHRREAAPTTVTDRTPSSGSISVPKPAARRGTKRRP